MLQILKFPAHNQSSNDEKELYKFIQDVKKLIKIIVSAKNPQKFIFP